MSTGLSRRHFLFGSATLGTGIMAAGALIALPKTALAEDEGTNEAASIEPSETHTCDFVVAGSGTTGLCAAIRAAELGASVILVDVNTENGVGGNSRYVENLGEVGEGQEGADKLYNDLVEYHRHASNAIVTRRFADDSAKVIEWTKENQNIEFKVGR